MKLFCSIPLLAWAVLFQVSPLCAQDKLAPQELSPDPEASRILPRIETPVLNAVPSPTPTQAPGPNLVPDVAPGDLVSDVLLCMAMVSPDLGIDLQPLIEAGWAWDEPEQTTLAGRPAQVVSYYRGNKAISLVDSGSYTVCRVNTSVHDANRVPALRAALQVSLGAIQANQLPQSSALLNRLCVGLDTESLPLMLITEGYMVGLDGWPETAQTLGIATEPNSFTRIRVSVSPIALSFRLSSLDDEPNTGISQCPSS